MRPLIITFICALMTVCANAEIIMNGRNEIHKEFRQFVHKHSSQNCKKELDTLISSKKSLSLQEQYVDITNPKCKKEYYDLKFAYFQKRIAKNEGENVEMEGMNCTGISGRFMHCDDGHRYLVDKSVVEQLRSVGKKIKIIDRDEEMKREAGKGREY